ncbi:MULTISPECIES: DUF3284 domain-containing protein [Lactobacillus]|uniref:DUF3284 domain-containing protein n=1 Tax=Lactobacillus xujianguonis TaxID=2495899 RepID=A0A437SUN2_9LACO|nr:MULTISPECIES: DUF3284 domain-containing protein [Lactobacillus]RVU70635.1 DUF3284 domain-containing protein [Lactobacillus xujianguonis]RVU73828.1 DUF3284 domain-containing protein [Lactobacillus xujianguonis]
MITITRQYNFKAKDFFNYLEAQLVPTIKKARGNNLPVTLTKGTKYEMADAKVEITDYERNKLYAARFQTRGMDIVIKYVTEDIADGVKITFSEDMLSFDREHHGKLQTMFYNFQLKMGAKRELKRMADNVYAHLAN